MRKKVYRKMVEYRDPGFGINVVTQGERFINRDGSFNVEKKGLPLWQRFSLYHVMLNIPWWKFILIILTAYCVINILFALLYLAIGFENLQGATAETPLGKFFEAFFFSAQTFTTVGYGRINPVGLMANFLVVFELLLGLLSLALATGLFFARSSRPVGKIMFSEKALVAPYRGSTGLMFRIANSKDNQLIEVEVQFMLSRIEMENGNPRRKFYQMEVERSSINFLSMSWTIVHPITDNSPLYGCTEQQLKESDAEFMILIKGFDDTFAQTIHSRTSYKHFEIEWGAKFKSTYDRGKNGKTVIDLSTLGAYEKVPLPVAVVHQEEEETETPLVNAEVRKQE